MGDRDAKSEFGHTKVRDVPMIFKLAFEKVVFFAQGRDRNSVVNVNSEKCNSSLRFIIINAPLVDKATEAQFNHCLMECEVPYSACLLHSIKTLHELPYLILFTTFLESWGLFHEDSFQFRENSMKESCFNVKVLDIPV